MEPVSSVVAESPAQPSLPIDRHRSESIGKLIAALAKAQLTFKAVVKDAENPAYTRGARKSMYATLDSVIAATREALAKNDLVVIAMPQELLDNNKLKITSILAHSSEQFIESTIVMPAVDRVSPQELGKLITYARRYQWQSLVGVAPEDDDDANQSSGAGTKAAQEEVVAEKKSAAAKNAPIPALFYAWHDESQTAEITGDESLMKANKDVLKPLWNANSKTVVATADQLESLKYTFQQRNVQFRLNGKGEVRA